MIYNLLIILWDHQVNQKGHSVVLIQISIVLYENVCLTVPINIWWNDTHKTDLMVFHHMHYNKNIMAFLLFRKGKVFLFQIKMLCYTKKV